jgi:tetratricopeptide (TPR) repeat protein
LGQRRRESETERLAQAKALRDAGPSGLPGSPPNANAVTLEALQRDFTASGFLPVEPQPGLLAAMSAGDSSILSPVPSSSSASITAARIPSLGPKRVELPEAVAEDMPGRLRLARTWRHEGRLDDALAEYRALIKQAPDLLPQLLDELHECLKQSPENPEVHRLLGDARIQQGDYLGALEAYNRAVALTHPDAL